MRPVLLGTLALLAGVPARGANLGIVHGTVHDEQGRPIPEVQVEAFVRQKVRVDVHVTDAAGHFEFEQLPFGRYRLVFSAPDGRMDDREVQVGSGDVLDVDVTLPTLEETVTVTAPVREASRPSTSPSSAATLDREEIRALPRGDTQSVNDILGSRAGFVKDALGQIYVRGNHAGIQYQLDGVPLPDTVSGVFGQFLSPKLVENMEVLTGGLPAEYGQRVSAVVNLNSRRPPPEGEGQAELLYGSFRTWTPSAFWGKSFGKYSLLTGGSFTWTQRGLDPPNPASLLHDRSRQGRAFVKLDADLNDRDHVSALFSYAQDRFEIPVDPALVPGDTTPDAFGNPPPPYFPPSTRQTQLERDAFGLVSWRHDYDSQRSLRVAGYARRSSADFFGDAAHALAPPQTCVPDPSDASAPPDCPGVSDVDRTAWHAGVVADYLQRLGDRHVLKFGATVDQLWGSTRFTAYRRLAAPPPDFAVVGQGSDDSTATSGGVYAQDRATFGKLTVTGGLRFDFQSVAFGSASRVTDVGFSPRLGASWAFTPDLVAHAFVGLLWTPPAVLDAPAAARQLGIPGVVPYDLRPEKDRYAELGVKARLSPKASVGLNLWGRLATDPLDEVELGQTAINAPYNFADGRAGGVEATFDTVVTQNLTAFGNVSFGTAQGRGIATARYLFDAGALASTAWQTLDHAQTWTGNLGAAYRDGGTQVSTLLAFGSGLRTGGDNTSHVPGWARVDVTLSHDFYGLPLRPTVAIDVVNLFDASYAYRLYNGFNGSHWAPGRSVYLRASVNL